MSEDLIRRNDAIKALQKLGHEVVVIDKVCSLGVAHEFIDAIRAVPSADRPQKIVAQITFDEEKLREIVKEAVERFKEEYEIEPKRGEWIGYNADKGSDWLRSDGEPIFLVCNKCYGTVMNNTSAHWNFCPNCGARMKGADDE